ncbi:SPOR domain-containing protein [Pseudomonas sp. HR96]|uniref:SPOR domain-containing protein n=1 Tax=Pseudomonas sp. HR96 TaxID=1027966 RepID=UPI002A759E3C|nr:SPOR domain-containing protein [Pseudomonas sp. HR96]WPO98720.1 SPOR domain-containing protein [Pseudomonas sp. HR96]
MALLDNVFKQRMVGALVLIALAVIFLPMLFSREDELRQVRVDAPAAPQAPVVPEVKIDPVAVPQQQPVAEQPVIEEQPDETPQAPSAPIKAIPAAPVAASKPAAKPATAATQPAQAPAKPAAVASAPAKPDTAAKIDTNGLPISWSIQLASLGSRASADSLQKTLRSQGYNAYVRSADGKNRVFVGPLVERAEAERVRDVIARQQNLKGILVRFEPERG